MKKKYIYFVGGGPGSGKTTYIQDHKQEGDAVVFVSLGATEELEKILENKPSRIFVEAPSYPLELRFALHKLLSGHDYTSITIMCETL